MPEELDTSFHTRRQQQRMHDPVYREEYERAKREIGGVDDIMRRLEERRVEVSITKAELARRIHKDPAEVRRLLGTGSTNPQLVTVVQLALELGLELRLVATSE